MIYFFIGIAVVVLFALYQAKWGNDGAWLA